MPRGGAGALRELLALPTRTLLAALAGQSAGDRARARAASTPPACSGPAPGLGSRRSAATTPATPPACCDLDDAPAVLLVAGDAGAAGRAGRRHARRGRPPWRSSGRGVRRRTGWRSPGRSGAGWRRPASRSSAAWRWGSTAPRTPAPWTAAEHGRGARRRRRRALPAQQARAVRPHRAGRVRRLGAAAGLRPAPLVLPGAQPAHRGARRDDRRRRGRRALGLAHHRRVRSGPRARRGCRAGPGHVLARARARTRCCATARRWSATPATSWTRRRRRGRAGRGRRGRSPGGRHAPPTRAAPATCCARWTPGATPSRRSPVTRPRPRRSWPASPSSSCSGSCAGRPGGRYVRAAAP